jgi:DNA modification methylase
VTEQKIIQGDCIDVMKTFPDKSFDLVLTDPPYGIGVGGTVGGANHLVKVGGENLSSPKVTGGSMTHESPKERYLKK